MASYTPDLALIGEWDPDVFFLVEWPSWRAFTALATESEYLEIAREARRTGAGRVRGQPPPGRDPD